MWSVVFRLIGLWLGDHAPGWPDVTNYIDPDRSGSQREEIAGRLDGGERTDRAYMGYSRCRICGCQNGSGELTNGDYIWPEGLAHYVRNHAVRLPAVIESELLLRAHPDPGLVAQAVRASNDERDVTWWKAVTGVGAPANPRP